MSFGIFYFQKRKRLRDYQSHIVIADHNLFLDIISFIIVIEILWSQIMIIGEVFLVRKRYKDGIFPF